MIEPKPIYLQKIKLQNMAAILHTIWEQETISRVELVKLTGLTSGTITNLTQELIHWGLIHESETSSKSIGRRRVNLKLHAEHYIIIGLDIGRTTYEIVMTDLLGSVLKSVEGSTTGIDEPTEVLDLIEPHLQSMKAYALGKRYPIIGLGVSIPGPIDRDEGTLLSPPNFPGWEGYPIRDILTKRFGLKVYVEDDARASALAEGWFGLGRKCRDLVFVTMGMGIGGGVISKGVLAGGSNGLYGQVGHMTLLPKGAVCACGNEGCWETIGSIPGILRRWSGGDTIDDLFLAVHQGDPLANSVLNETLYFLESALITLFNMYDPDVIILGGRLHPYLSEYMPAVKSKVKSRVYAFAQERLMIEPSTFGTSQNAIGAVALVFGNLLAEPYHIIAP